MEVVQLDGVSLLHVLYVLLLCTYNKISLTFGVAILFLVSLFHVECVVGTLHKYCICSKLRVLSVSKRFICNHLELAVILVFCLFKLFNKYRILREWLGPVGRSSWMGRKWMGRYWNQRVVYCHCHQRRDWLNHNDFDGNND